MNRGDVGINYHVILAAWRIKVMLKQTVKQVLQTQMALRQMFKKNTWLKTDLWGK
jgi:hypothetical protein